MPGKGRGGGVGFEVTSHVLKSCLNKRATVRFVIPQRFSARDLVFKAIQVVVLFS